MSSIRHTAPLSCAISDNQLVIGGFPITRLTERVGRTPFYAYDRALISARIAQLRQAMPDQIHLHYAIKANPMPAVVQHLAGLVDGFDVASGGELKTVLDTPMPPNQISFAGPAKSPIELRQAIAAGIVINLESERELLAAVQAGEALGIRPKVAVRVNPDFELKSSGMKMSGGPKQFGIDAEQVPAVLGRMKTMDLEFIGFHIFSGSQNLRAEAISEAQEKTLELAMRLALEAPAPVRALNLGGGFGIPYFPGEQPLDLAAVGARLSELLPAARHALPDTELIIELGRFIIGEAGVYVCRVVERKLSRGQVFLVTDGGLHHHLAASGNFGQVIRKNYPVLVANRVESGDEPETASVVGPLCTPLDLLADKMLLGHAREGDLIAVMQSGAYGLTASPTAFLGHPPPVEVLV
ncbi:pyridoxal-dependent decarboxylase, exosortase A system-associated [Thiorhodococcus mannitoliphagus]|uniref:Pyridoxal-dependent decarboxylase, exosortase A system-associated n=1 Tax=Thiorhodococcus mannitoliphagus TaxID=329406 RepID=A0A6P1DT72_9GAMM|nr:pyridoxal-dependent decarboxylase, exosortase A system-associated [Thiorhodococcus mannitoliphagus]NEX21019.1 pyridoxal-dependent decarboxylase, exosortase A system-associated [Thiorhodococcus mannitoliphagus]